MVLSLGFVKTGDTMKETVVLSLEFVPLKVRSQEFFQQDILVIGIYGQDFHNQQYV